MSHFVTECRLVEFEQQLLELLGGEQAMERAAVGYGDTSCLLSHHDGQRIGLL